MNSTEDLGGGRVAYLCPFCGLPSELVGGGQGSLNFACRHRPKMFGGGGHRAHALCCATSKREGVRYVGVLEVMH